jgi:hypothetical protein
MALRQTWRVLSIVYSLMVLGGVAAGEQAAASAEEQGARAAAIAATKAAIEQEAKAQGGWDAWYKKLKPMQEDFAKIIGAQKWPWPAKNDYVFYRTSAQLLMMESWDKQPAGADPLAAIVSLDRQLKKRGIDLIYMPIPDKLSIYSDYLSDKAPADRAVFAQSKQLLHRLSENDVEAVDLFTVYRDFRREHPDQALYYTKDGHWRNVAARIAGERIAERLKRYAFVRKALAGEALYETKKDARTDGVKADGDLLRVLLKGGASYKDAGDSPVVLTGDSFSMYNMGERAAHLSAQVARCINMPVTYVCREGLAQDMPLELAKRGPDFLNARRVIVWTTRGRCLAEGGWCAVDLSGKRKSPQPLVQSSAATCVAGEVAQRPKRDAAYAHYVMQVRVKELKDARGRPIGDGEAILHVLAMKDRKLLAAAGVEKGQKLELKLTTWALVEGKYGKINTGELEDVAAAASLARYWAEMPGQEAAPVLEASK